MILYHYCSTYAFFNILKDRTLFLSSLTSSNDTREGRWLSEVLRDVLIRKKAKRSVVSELVRQLSTVEETSIAYGFCLSQRRDMLSQWRGYADDASGFAIGFDKEALQRAVSGLNLPTLVDPRLLPVAYKESDQAALIEADVDQILERLEGHTLFRPTILGNQDMDKALEVYKAKLEMVQESINKWWRFIFATKNPAFEDEHEWRLIQEDALSHLGVDFRVRGSELVPYVKLDFPKDVWEGMVKEIWIGPKNRTSREVVRDFARTLELSARVVISSASYR